MSWVLRVRAAARRMLATRPYVVRPALARRARHAQAAVALARRSGDSVGLGRSLAALCRVLLQRGRPAEACAPGEEAVGLLGGRERDDAAVYLATALRLADRPADALTVVERVVANYRARLEHAPRGRRVLRVRLGFALTEYGQCLAALDRHAEAVTVLRESLRYLDELALSQIVRSVHRRIAAGQTLTRSLLQTGSGEEAVTEAAATLEWSAIVARFQPSVGRSTHATTLGWLAQAQLSTGDYGASLRTARQAVAAYRVVRNAPDDRAAGLAWVLQLLARSAEQAGEIDEARAALSEAVEQSAALAGRNDPSRAYHAAVLVAWFDLLTRHGRADEAGDVAVAAAPRLWDYPPSAAVGRLLCGAAAAHHRAGRLDEARSVIDDAVRVAVSAKDNAGLVQALILRARNFQRSNNLQEAIKAVDAAIAALPSRASVDPVPANDTDVLVHGYRAELLAGIGDLTAAEASAREAVVIGRAVKDSQNLGPVLAGLAQILRDQHRHDAAAGVGAEAAQAYRAIVARDPTKTPQLLACLRLRAHDLLAIWRADEAIPVVEEALAVSRRLRSSDAEAGTDELARSLRIAARAYAAADRLDRAIDALRTLRDLARDHPTNLRNTLATAAFAEALRAAPQTLPGAWEAVTQQPYPGENAPA